MTLPHDKFCVLPWISLEASPIGSVRPCCLADDEVVDNQGVKFNLHSAKLQEIQDSNYMCSLRREFLNGQQPKTCRKCWNEENSGRTSKRMHMLDKFKHHIENETWTTEAKPLLFLDLKLGNICNLKCRICGSWSSSTYATEELQKLAFEQRKSSFHYQMLRQGAWPRESAVFWEEIEHVINDIRYIEFTGGEPFMIKEHFALLERMVVLGVADKIELHYNTNGTIYPTEAEDLWRHFKHVEIAFSIDDIGPRFEYQRSGASWWAVVDNLQKFYALRNTSPNISLQVCCTINVFNVMYLGTIVNWIDSQPFDFVYWNMLHDAPVWSIGTLPDATKDIIARRIGDSKIPEKYWPEINKIIHFMRSGPSSDGTELLKKIKELDATRSESFATTMPWLHEILEPHYGTLAKKA